MIHSNVGDKRGEIHFLIKNIFINNLFVTCPILV